MMSGVLPSRRGAKDQYCWRITLCGVLLDIYSTAPQSLPGHIAMSMLTLKLYLCRITSRILKDLDYRTANAKNGQGMGNASDVEC